jgi:hypothetical protein
MSVKEDPTGSLSATLRGHADVGDSLFRRGKRVSDRTGFARWLGELLAWRALTTEALAAEFEKEAVKEFLQDGRSERAVESWRRNLRSQLRVLRNEVEFLDSLHSTLTWQALERRGRFERSQRSPAPPAGAVSHASRAGAGAHRPIARAPARVAPAGSAPPPA